MNSNLSLALERQIDIPQTPRNSTNEARPWNFSGFILHFLACIYLFKASMVLYTFWSLGPISLMLYKITQCSVGFQDNQAISGENGDWEQKGQHSSEAVQGSHSLVPSEANFSCFLSWKQWKKSICKIKSWTPGARGLCGFAGIQIAHPDNQLQLITPSD